MLFHIAKDVQQVIISLVYEHIRDGPTFDGGATDFEDFTSDLEAT